MKKILYLLVLTALFVSCSSDDDNTDNNKKEENGMIDEKILGKWKVEYSKTIKGARFLDDGTLEIAEGAIIIEYNGDYTGHIDQVPKSGIFDDAEFKIEIKDNNTIVSSVAGANNKAVYYKVENGLLIWVSNMSKPTSSLSQSHKYKIENNKLIIERIPTKQNGYIYTISEYSKITE